MEGTGKMRRFQITRWCHDRIGQMMPHPADCLDATAGTGRDTVFLLEISDTSGTVTAMDIQQEAIDLTEKRITQEMPDHKKRLRLIRDGHQYMDRYFPPRSLDLILFNLGYLPGGDHKLATRPDTTISGLNHALTLLRPGGLVSVLIYSGGDSGYEEKEAVLEWAGSLDPHEYLVILESFYNRPNDPPLPIYIIKQK